MEVKASRMPQSRCSSVAWIVVEVTHVPRRVFSGWCLVALLLVTAACQEEGTVQVHKLTFKGVKAVKESELEGAATRTSSRLPWGRSVSSAFAIRHGLDPSPRVHRPWISDARIVFRCEAEQAADAVDLTVTISKVRGAGRRAEFLWLRRRPDHFREMTTTVPLKVRRPEIDCRWRPPHWLDELRDHRPVCKVTVNETTVRRRQARLSSRRSRPPRALRSRGSKSWQIGDHIIEREVAYKPGELYSEANSRIRGISTDWTCFSSSRSADRSGPAAQGWRRVDRGERTSA
jgi:hypothetical protein